MVKPVNDHDQPHLEADHDPGKEPDAPLSDDALLDLLDALVEERGRVPAAQVLGVNYRTLSHCCDSRQVSRRMRQALVEFHAARGSADCAKDVGDADGAAVVVDAEARERRVAELEEENRRLRETVAEQDCRLEELTELAAAPEVVEDQVGDIGPVEAGDVQGDVPADERADGFEPGWRPPRRRPGMPDAGVVTVDGQPDEEDVFGPAAPLVAE